MDSRLVRRLPATLLVTLLAAVGLGAAVGVATGHGGGSDRQVLDHIDVPAARLGDAGGYDATLTGDWKPGPFTTGAPFRILDFGWQPGAPVRGGDGAVVPTDVVATHGYEYDLDRYNMDADGDGHPDHVSWVPHDDRELYQQGTSRLVARQSDLDVSDSQFHAGPIPLLPSLLGDNATASENTTARAFTPLPDCLLDNAAQGGTLDATANQTLFRQECGFHGLFELLPLAWRPMGTETVQGLPAEHFHQVAFGELAHHAPLAGGFFALPAAADVWLAPGLAYPLRLEVQVDGGMVPPGFIFNQSSGSITQLPPESLGPHTVRLDLVAFEPGSQGRTPGAGPSDRVPALATAPTKPWGADDSGAGSSFPASKAYQEAHDDPVHADLRNWLSSHPKAIASFAWSLPAFDDGATTRSSWWMQFEDRTGRFWLIVTRTTPDVLVGTPLEDAGSRYTEDEAQATPLSGNLDADSGPKELPTIASLMDRWTRYASPAEAALGGNSWMFSLYCSDAPCSKTESVFFVGHISIGSAMPSPDADHLALRYSFAMDDSQLVVEPGQDAAQAFYESRVAGSDSAGLMSAASQASPPGPALRTTVAHLVGIPLPSPAQAAGAGLLALLIGALYWLWPALKTGGAMGLFSRLRTARLLEHPHRARIADLVAAEPGIHFQELARRSGIPNGTLVHHLQKLVAADLVAAHRSGRYTCYFPRQATAAAKAAAGATKSEGSRAVLAAIQARPGVTMQDVALQCGLQPSTVTYHVQRLAQAGLVAVNRDGRFQRLQAAGAAA